MSYKQDIRPRLVATGSDIIVIGTITLASFGLLFLLTGEPPKPEPTYFIYGLAVMRFIDRFNAVWGTHKRSDAK